MLHLLRELLDDDDFRPEIEELRSLSLSITRQLNAWLDSLKKTKSVGHRHQSPEKREALEKAKRREEFLDYLKQVMDGRPPEMERSTTEESPPS